MLVSDLGRPDPDRQTTVALVDELCGARFRRDVFHKILFFVLIKISVGDRAVAVETGRRLRPETVRQFPAAGCR